MNKTPADTATTPLETDTVEVLAPTERSVQPCSGLPEVQVFDGSGQSLIERARQLGAIRIAVVHPCDATSLAAALDAFRCGLIEPVLVAPRRKLEQVAKEAALDLANIPIEDVPHSHAAAASAVALAASGHVDALMKGSLHTDELMAAVVATTSGLRTARRISHCYLMHTPAYPRPFIITDGAINIAPTLEKKSDIMRNAIDLAHIIGVAVTAARSPARYWMGHWPSTTRYPPPPRRSRASSRTWPAAPTSCWCPTWKAATC